MRMLWAIAVLSLTTVASGQSRTTFRTRGGGLVAMSVDRCDGASCAEWVSYPSQPPRAAVQTSMSRSSKHFFVWSRADGHARDLDIFDTPTGNERAHRTAHFAPGYGGELTWLQDDRLWHVWGCGSGCVAVGLYDTNGREHFGGVGSVASASPDGTRVALVDGGSVSMVMAHTLEVFHAKAPPGTVTGFAWRSEGFLVSFYGAHDRLHCTPTPPGTLTCVPG